MLVNVVVSVGQFQRDLANETTRDGLAAARAEGKTSGRRPRHAELGATEQIRRPTARAGPASPPWPVSTGSAAPRSGPRSPT